MNLEPEWKRGTPKELIADLRVGGWVQGHSGQWSRFLRLHKTDLIHDLKQAPADTMCVWRIMGDPEATGRYAFSRRRVVLWLGK